MAEADSSEVSRVCVIGAGPAGLSAALWLHNLGLQVSILEQSGKAGGMQHMNFLPNDWVLGQPGLTGPELAERFVAHVRAHREIQLLCASTPLSVRRVAEKRFQVSLIEGPVLDCEAILIATGTRYRAEETMSGVAGFEDCRDRFVFGPHAFRGLEDLSGQRILVVGGGDNAFENARFLVARGCAVTLAARSGLRAQRAMRQAVEAEPGCRILFPARLHEVRMQCGALMVKLGGDADTLYEGVFDRIHVLAGYQPNTGFLQDCLEEDCLEALVFDAQGYLKADAACRTPCAGLYAAGDVCNVAHPCVVTALAAGAQAARSIELDLRTR